MEENILTFIENDSGFGEKTILLILKEIMNCLLLIVVLQSLMK